VLLSSGDLPGVGYVSKSKPMWFKEMTAEGSEGEELTFSYR
jgi:hypothetical protein